MLIQTLWFKNIPVYMSLWSFSCITQVCMLLWPTPHTANVPKVLMYFFISIFTFSSTNKKANHLHLMAKKDSEGNLLCSFVLLRVKDGLFIFKHCPQNISPFFFFHVLKIFWLCQLWIRSLTWLPASAFGLLKEKSHLVFYILLAS